MDKLHYWYGPSNTDMYYDTPNGTANYVGSTIDAYDEYGLIKKLKYIGEFSREELTYHPPTINPINEPVNIDGPEAAVKFLLDLKGRLEKQLAGEGLDIYPGPISTEFTEYDKINLKFFHIDV